MDTKMIRFCVGHAPFTEWEGRSLKELNELLLEMIAKVPEGHEGYVLFDSCNAEVSFMYDREETEEERNNRLARDAQIELNRVTRQKNARKALYEELKLEFGE